jgi:hypothetical protein
VTWKIDWKPDGRGLALHAPTGATFHVSRSGSLGLNEAASLSEARLAELVTELRTLLDQVAAVSLTVSHRVH